MFFVCMYESPLIEKTVLMFDIKTSELRLSGATKKLLGDHLTRVYYNTDSCLNKQLFWLIGKYVFVRKGIIIA